MTEGSGNSTLSSPAGRNLLVF